MVCTDGLQRVLVGPRLQHLETFLVANNERLEISGKNVDFCLTLKKIGSISNTEAPCYHDNSEVWLTR